MIVLCDTCSVLMVIRIAPDMFTDEKYECATTAKVHNELFRTQKFKEKYPWRANYKPHVSTLGSSVTSTDGVNLHLSVINAIIETGVTNPDTGFLVDLSPTDKHVIACATANQFDISSVDRNLVYFAESQFDIRNVTPLGLVNHWLEQGLISWNDHLQMVIADWQSCGESEQPLCEVGRFQRLTGYRYVGP